MLKRTLVRLYGLTGWVRIITVIAITLLLFPISSWAQPATNPGLTTPDVHVSTGQELLDAFCNVFVWMFWFIMAISILMGMWAAYSYITAQDDTEKTAKATRTLTYVAIGIAVALLAKAMPLIVQDFFDVSNQSIGCTPGTA